MEKQTEMNQKIESWRKAHGEIFCYEADGMTCYLKRPGRNIIAAAVSVGSSNPIKFAEIILENCWLGGDETLRTDDSYFLGLQQKVNELVDIKVGSLKKL